MARVTIKPVKPPAAPCRGFTVRWGKGETFGYFLGVGAARLFGACLIEAKGHGQAAYDRYHRLSKPEHIEEAVALVDRHNLSGRPPTL